MIQRAGKDQEFKKEFLSRPDNEQELYSLLVENLMALTNTGKLSNLEDVRSENPENVHKMKELIAKMHKEAKKQPPGTVLIIPTVEEFSTVTSLISRVFFHYGMGGDAITTSPAVSDFVELDLGWMNFHTKERENPQRSESEDTPEETKEESCPFTVTSTKM